MFAVISMKALGAAAAIVLLGFVGLELLWNKKGEGSWLFAGLSFSSLMCSAMCLIYQLIVSYYGR